MRALQAEEFYILHYAFYSPSSQGLLPTLTGVCGRHPPSSCGDKNLLCLHGPKLLQVAFNLPRWGPFRLDCRKPS